MVRDGLLPVAASKLVDFSPDGLHAAISGAAGEFVVLDVRTGEPVRSPAPGHAGGILSLSYSSDGRRILSSGTDSTAALWDGATGLLVARSGFSQPFVTAGFLPGEDSVLVSDAFGGPAYRWNTDPEAAADFACKAAGRDLDPEEWRDNFGDRPYEATCPGY